MEREALKLALDALENHCGNYKLDDAGCDRHDKAIIAIQAALAQPAQEPLVWKLKDKELGCGLRAHITAREYNDKIFKFQQCYEFIGSITTPPAAQPAQEPDMLTIAYQSGYYDGKKAAFAQPAQEPVECLDCGSNNVGLPATYDSLVDSVKVQPAQEQRPWVGLTPEDILALFDEHNLYGSKLVEFTRAVETKIKEKNND
jgi:hypothetical protein